MGSSHPGERAFGETAGSGGERTLALRALGERGNALRLLAAALVGVAGAWLLRAPSDPGRVLVLLALLSGLFLGAFLRGSTRAVIAARGEKERRIRDLEAAAARVQEASRVQARLLSATGHDLRQPLHAMRLTANALRSATSDAERDRLAAMLDDATASLGAQLDLLIDFARTLAGDVECHPRIFRAGSLLDAIEAELGTAARSRGLELRVVRSGAWLESDPELVKAILLQLVLNAIHHTETGRILVGCKRAGDQVRIGVWDTGPGIAEEDQRAIFRAFERRGGTTQGSAARGSTAAGRTSGHGLGLGLTIVERLAARLGHRVVLRSSVGRGSYFALEVPCARGHEPKAVSGSGARSLAGLRVAIVDDDREVLRASEALLRAYGAEPRGLHDPEHALELLGQEWIPDVLLVDLRLPGERDGVAWVDALRRRCGVPIPAILVTGDSEADALEVARAGRFVLLGKPVSGAQLRQALERFVAS
ncbi:MAG: hybrid sensor histidine kinase/response regulator [Myxococcota bacterium]